MGGEQVFGLIFLAQIFAISFYYPRRIKARARAANTAGKRGALGAYGFANTLILLAGLALLASFFALPIFDGLTTKLAAIGLYFFLQLAPLILPAARRTLEATDMPQAFDEDTAPSIRLFDVVAPVPVLIAALLIAAYLVSAFSDWGGGSDTQLLKIAIFAGTNIFFLIMAATLFAGVRKGGTEDIAKRVQQLRRQVPALVYLSIGVSIYHFGKHLLFDFDLQAWRPVMMSAFLLMLAALTLEAQLRRQRKVVP